MSILRERFEFLLQLIESANYDPSAVSMLRPGLSEEAIRASIKVSPVPDSLIQIYSCVNGSVSPDYDFLFSAWRLYPIEQINDEIDLRNKLNIEYPETSEYKEDMIPFLEDGGGGHLFVRSLPNDHSIWEFAKGVPAKKCFQDMEHFIETVIAYYQREAFFYDEDDAIWYPDIEMMMEIHSELNPGYEFFA